MIWHIFRKDIRLLWPLVVIVAAVQFMNASLQFILAPFGEPHELGPIAEMFVFATLPAIAVLIATNVHQDALPGDRRDWLVRPIRRLDLIFAKLLFLLVAVHGPVLLADLAHGMAGGFVFWDSLLAALSRCLLLLLTFSVPIFAVAAITSTLVEFTGGVLAIGLVGTGIFIVTVATARGGSGTHIASSGLNWMPDAFVSAVALAAAVAIVPLQYFRRVTMRARSIALGAVLLVPMSLFVPWALEFSFQQWFSVDPAAAKAIAVAFDPDLGKLVIERGIQRIANSVWLPVQVSGLAPESIVISDRADVRITDRDGILLYRGRTTGNTNSAFNTGYGPARINDFPVRTTAGGDVRTHQFIILPRKIYDLVRTQPVRIEVDYSLTLFHIVAADTIEALSGDKRIADFGWCKTKIDDDGDEVELGCLNMGSAPTCATAVLENTASGQRNPAHNMCRPDYRPYAENFLPDAMATFGGGISFQDLQGLAKYPVDGPQLADSHVSLKSYQPVAHFTRHLDIPEIRLGDWEAEQDPK